MHGLGLYIYAGEDLPEDDQPEQKPAPRHSPIDPVGVTEAREAILKECAEYIKDRMASDDVVGAYECASDVKDPEEKQFLWRLLDSKIRSAIKKHADALKEPA